MSSIRKKAVFARNKLLGTPIRELSDLAARISDIEGKLDSSILLQQQIDRRLHNSGVLTLSESEIIAKIFTGQKVYLDPRDLALVPHLALDGVWEVDITQAWMSVVPKRGTVLDIGANFGYYGIIAGQKMQRKDSRIVMFEANPDLIPYVEKSLDVNWLNEPARVENLAVTDKAGTVTLNVLKGYLGSSSLQTTENLDKYLHEQMHLETEKQVKVQAVTIDEYCQDYGISTVDLIKMDIEGYEDRAYNGMKGLITNSPNAILFVEFTKQSYAKPREFFADMLADFGNLYLIRGDGSLQLRQKPDYDTIIGSTDSWVMLVFSKRKLT